MKKKKYEKPAMRVYEMKHRTMILAGSGGAGDMPDYSNGGDPFNS